MLTPRVPESRTPVRATQLNWVRFKNVGSIAIPPWKIVEVVDVEYHEPTPNSAPFAGGITYHVKQPSSYLAYELGSSGPYEIPGSSETNPYGPGLVGSLLVSDDVADVDVRGIPTGDSFTLKLDHGGPLVSNGQMGSGNTMWHYEPSAMDGVFVCNNAEVAAVPKPDACTDMAMVSGTGSVLLTAPGGTFFDTEEDLTFFHTLPVKIAADEVVYVHRNANGAFHTIAKNSTDCEQARTQTTTATQDYPAGLIGEFTVEPCEEGGATTLAATPTDCIKKGDTVILVPTGCEYSGILTSDQECEYKAVPIPNCDFSKLHNVRFQEDSYITSKEYCRVYRYFQVKQEDCECEISVSPPIYYCTPYECCYPCAAECWTYVLPKQAEEYWMVCYDSAGGGAVPAGHDGVVGTALLATGDVAQIVAFCGYGAHTASGTEICKRVLSTDPRNACEQLLYMNTTNISQLLSCNEDFKCPASGGCDSVQVSALEAIGWVQVGETDNECIFAICTECPTDTKLDATRDDMTLTGTLIPGSPCEHFEDSVIDTDLLPECCDCETPPERCWSLRLSDEVASCADLEDMLQAAHPDWTLVHTEGYECFFAICYEGDGPPPVPTSGTFPAPQLGSPCLLYEDVDIPQANVPLNSSGGTCCECDDTAKKCYVAQVPGGSSEVYHTWTNSGVPSGGANCQAAEEVGAGDNSYKVYEVCCTSNPGAPWVAGRADLAALGAANVELSNLVETGTGPYCPDSTCSVDAQLTAEGWTYIGTITGGTCIWAICSTKKPSIPWLWQEGNPCQLHSDLSLAIDPATLCTECKPCTPVMEICNDCNSIASMTLHVGTVTSNCAEDDCSQIGGDITLVWSGTENAWVQSPAVGTCGGSVGVDSGWKITCTNYGTGELYFDAISNNVITNDQWLGNHTNLNPDGTIKMIKTGGTQDPADDCVIPINLSLTITCT